MSEWDGKLPLDGWHWLERRDNGERRMAYYTKRDGWRVSDSIGRTGLISERKVAQRFRLGGRAVVPSELQVVMIGDCGFYVPEPVKLEIERLRQMDWQGAKVSIDMDTHFDGDGLRVYGRVVDWQYEDYAADGKGKGLRLLCEFESDNFDMQKPR